jgi:hypothetical protein
VPWKRAEIEKMLARNFDANWSNGGTEVRPPGTTPVEVLENLVTLGIIRARGDSSFDVPDLYLSGFDLVRRGGVLRR